MANDDDATFKNIQESPVLLWLTTVSFIVIAMLDIAVFYSLYGAFKSTHARLSRAMALARIIYTIVLVVAIGYLFHAGLMVDDPLARPATMGQSLRQFIGIWSLGLIIFGVHLLLLGWLLSQNPVVPRLVTCLVVIAGFCYAAVHAAKAILPQHITLVDMAESILALPMAIGELALAGWMLKGSWRNSNSNRRKKVKLS